MAEIEKLRKFVHFLKEKNAYEAFIKNFEEYRKTQMFLRYIEKTRQNNFINEAFGWRVTPQGSNYWNKLDLSWIDYLKCENNV